MITILFEPSFVSPHLSDVDVSNGVEFTGSINASGSTSVTHAQIIVKDLNNATKVNTGKVALVSPLYNNDDFNIYATTKNLLNNGEDYIWNITLYESIPDIWVTSGFCPTAGNTTTLYVRKNYENYANSAIKAGMYVRIRNEIHLISAYDNSTGKITFSTPLSFSPAVGDAYTILSNYIISDDFYLRGRSTPNISIINSVDVIKSNSYTFSGSYSQEQNVDWRYYTWNLYNREEVISTSGQQNDNDINFQVDNLLTDEEYTIELIIENQDGYILKTTESFSVDYQQTNLSLLASTEFIREKSALEIKWEQPLLNLGIASGEEDVLYTISKNEISPNKGVLNLKDKSKVEYYIETPIEGVTVDENSTTYLLCNISKNFSGDIIKLENLLTNEFYIVSFEYGVFKYNIDDKYKGEITVQSEGTNWILTDSGVPVVNTNYIWEDSESWSDSKYWTERGEDSLYDSWWQIFLLPTRVVINKLNK